jgi:predicted O-methyltransferase YrrM
MMASISTGAATSNDRLGKLYEEDGFCVVDILDERGLEELRHIVNDKFHEIIRIKYPEFFDEYSKLTAEDYHKKSSLIDHANTFRKAMRTFDRQLVDRFMRLPWRERLSNLVGPFEVLGVGEVGLPDVYMRLVRPNAASDVGPIHADHWFTELGNHEIDPGLSLLKIWIPVYSEPDRDGLLGVPGSHIACRDLRYDKELRDGYIKPVLPKSTEQTLCPIRIKARPGQAVIFTYHFLHGGSLNEGLHTRVSLEATLVLGGRVPAVVRSRTRGTDNIRSSPTDLCTAWTGSLSAFFGEVRKHPAATTRERINKLDLELPDDRQGVDSYYDAGKIALLTCLLQPSRSLRILSLAGDIGITALIVAQTVSRDSKIIVVEPTRRLADVTVRNISRHRLDHMVSIMQMEYRTALPFLAESSPYDLIILDEGALHIVDTLVSLLGTNGRMMIDGLLCGGETLHERPVSDRGRQSKELLRRIDGRSDLSSVLLPLSSGILLMTRHCRGNAAAPSDER